MKKQKNGVRCMDEAGTRSPGNSYTRAVHETTPIPFVRPAGWPAPASTNVLHRQLQLHTRLTRSGLVGASQPWIIVRTLEGRQQSTKRKSSKAHSTLASSLFHNQLPTISLRNNAQTERADIAPTKGQDDVVYSEEIPGTLHAAQSRSFVVVLTDTYT